MAREGSGPEILLVLCCLVAVCVFLCFSAGTVNLAASVGLGRSEETAASAINVARLEERKRELERAVAELDAELGALQQELATKQQEWSARRSLASSPSDVAQELQHLKRAEKQFRELLTGIERLKVAKERTRQKAAERARAEKVVQELEQKQARLREQLEQKRKTLAEVKIPADRAVDQGLRQLRQEISNLDENIAALKNALKGVECPTNAFCLSDLKGPTALRRPLIVECTRNRLEIHSAPKKRVEVSEVERNNPFARLPEDTDGIVFLIRPDGFEAFRRAFVLARETQPKLRYFYEAVEAGLQIRF